MQTEFNLDFEQDWEILMNRPFRRMEKTGELFRRFYDYLKRKDLTDMEAWRQAYTMKEWLLVPYSLWPIDFAGLGHFLEQQLAKGETLSNHLIALLDGLQDFEVPRDQDFVAAQERRVEKGEYNFLKKPEKFEYLQAALLLDPQLKKDYEKFVANFDITLLQDHKGVIRRTMLMERNFRPEVWSYREAILWYTQAALDLLCLKYDLYGFENGVPLLLKPAVTICAHATVIVIPRYLRCDWRRDFDWAAVTEMHDVHQPLRQVKKWSPDLLVREERRILLCKLDAEAKELKLKGEERWDYIRRGAGLDPAVEPVSIRRMMKPVL